jgi:hypothetical protein
MGRLPRRLAVVVALLVAVWLAWWRTSAPEQSPPAVAEITMASTSVAMATDRTISCDAPAGLQDGAHEVIELVAGGGGRTTVGVASRGRIELFVQSDSGRGGLYPVGWEPGVLAWDHGRCRFLEEPRILGAVHGMVDGWRELAAHTMWVQYCRPEDVDCRGLTPDVDGSFFVQRPAGETLVFRTQMTGGSTWHGPEVEIVPDATRDLVVTLHAPHSAAGYGVKLVDHDPEKLIVTDVLQGTAAHRAGLRVGDELLARNGRYLVPEDLKPGPTRSAPTEDVRLLVRDASGAEREVILLAAD